MIINIINSILKVLNIWSQVQVRQKTDNKKTFYYLEQLMLKHKAHKNTLSIKPEPSK